MPSLAGAGALVFCGLRCGRFASFRFNFRANPQACGPLSDGLQPEAPSRTPAGVPRTRSYAGKLMPPSRKIKISLGSTLTLCGAGISVGLYPATPDMKRAAQSFLFAATRFNRAKPTHTHTALVSSPSLTIYPSAPSKRGCVGAHSLARPAATNVLKRAAERETVCARELATTHKSITYVGWDARTHSLLTPREPQ